MLEMREGAPAKTASRRSWLLSLLIVVGCGTGELDVDFDTGGPPEAGDETPPSDGSVRVLSDTTPPNTRDVAPKPDTAADTGAGAGTGAQDAEAGATDGPRAIDADSMDVFADRLVDSQAPDARSSPIDAPTDKSGPFRDATFDARIDAGDGAEDATRVDGPSPDVTAIDDRAVTTDGAIAADGAGTADGAADGGGQCGDGVVAGDELCDDGNADRFDACDDCKLPAPHLLITEVVARPAGAEMIEIYNPTPVAVDLSAYLVSDSHLYYEIARGTFATASGSDFVARFPDGATLDPGRYVVIALGNASGGTQSFAATYGQLPDFELRPTANQATDDPAVANMLAVGTSIGASASLTDSGEPVVLFAYRDGDLVTDVDYVFYGVASASNPMVDKTGIAVGTAGYGVDTPPARQRAVSAPGESGSIHRCVYAEVGETNTDGNGMAGHDETSEDSAVAFSLGNDAALRTPGGPPPASVCKP